MQDTDQYFNLGIKLGAAAGGITPDQLPTLCGVVEESENVNNVNYGNLQRVVCKHAAVAFEKSGQQNDWCYHLFTKLAESRDWYPELDGFSDAVICAMGKVHQEGIAQEIEKAGDEIVKRASGFVGTLPGKAVALAPDALKTFAGLGVLGGAGLGSLYWLLNRHGQEDDTKNEELKAKIDYYNKLTNEVKAELQNNPPASTRDIKSTIENFL